MLAKVKLNWPYHTIVIEMAIIQTFIMIWHLLFSWNLFTISKTGVQKEFAERIVEKSQLATGVEDRVIIYWINKNRNCFLGTKYIFFDFVIIMLQFYIQPRISVSETNKEIYFAIVSREISNVCESFSGHIWKKLRPWRATNLGE